MARAKSEPAAPKEPPRFFTLIPTDTKIDFVGRRWSNPLWQIFDWALLALALGHGLNGLRTIIDDYVRNPARRATVKAVLYTLALGLFAFGTLTIFTFSS